MPGRLSSGSPRGPGRSSPGPPGLSTRRGFDRGGRSTGGRETRGREPRLTGASVQRTRKLIEREAVEHGWRIVDLKVEPDHIVVVIETWPNHSASRTVQRLQSASRPVGGSAAIPLMGAMRSRG